MVASPFPSETMGQYTHRAENRIDLSKLGYTFFYGTRSVHSCINHMTVTHSTGLSVFSILQTYTYKAIRILY